MVLSVHGGERKTPKAAAMQQIADWLEKLGMSEYAERFVESDIDTSVLSDLTDQELNDIVAFLATTGGPQ